MPICPKCQQGIPRDDVASNEELVWGKCTHCNILFRVLATNLLQRPPEALYKLWRERKRLHITGTMRGLIFQTTHHLTLGRKTLRYRWTCAAFSGSLAIPRERLQSVEPLAREPGTSQSPRPKAGFGILITYWQGEHSFRRRPRLKSLRIPVRTMDEQFWLLHEICTYLDRTTHYPSMYLKYRSKEYFGNDVLEMFFENRTVCMRLYCPQCGAGIPAEDIDIRSGRARCRRRFCGHVFSWKKIFEGPVVQDDEERIPWVSPRVAGYDDLSDIRAVHFASNANPFQIVPFGSEPPSPEPLAMPFFERPRISRKRGILTIDIRTNSRSEDTNKGSPRQILGGIFRKSLLSVLLLVIALTTAFIIFYAAKSLSHDLPSLLLCLWPLGFTATVLAFQFVKAFYLRYGDWQLSLGQGVLSYRRRCLLLRKQVSIPYGAINEVAARVVNSGWFSGAESFASHQIHIRYGEKRRKLVIPCNNTDEQIWILGELYESLRKRV